MLFKILKKLKLNGVSGAILLPAAQVLCRRQEVMTWDDAEVILSSHSPDPCASAFFPDAGEEKVPEVMLDIIVPVYNVESYLRDCAESILSQETVFPFRVIFVDDGSTDSSGRILEEYEDDSRVLVIHQENRGLSGARNTGISASNAKYLMFVDSDDRLAPGAVEAMLSAAEAHSAAMVQGCFATFFAEETPRRELSMERSCLINPPLDKLPGYAWGKVIRSSCFRHLRFPEGYWFEDCINAQLLYPLLSRDDAVILGIDDVVYHYRNNPKGISRMAQKKPKAIDSFWLTRQLHADRALFALDCGQKDYEYILDMVCLTYERTSGQPEAVQKALFIAWNAFLSAHFSGFHSQRKDFDRLEKAIQEKHYAQYCLCCKLL